MWCVLIRGQYLDLFPGNWEPLVGHYSSCWSWTPCWHVLYPGRSTDRALYTVYPIKMAPQWALFCVLLDILMSGYWTKMLISVSACVFWECTTQFPLFETTTRRSFSYSLPTFCPCCAIHRVLEREHSELNASGLVRCDSVSGQLSR